LLEYEIFSHFTELTFYIMLAMSALSVYWYIISARRRKLAAFKSEGKELPIYKQDNTIGTSHNVDLRFPNSTAVKRPSNGLITATGAYNNLNWTYDSVPLVSGATFDIYGRNYTFITYEPVTYRGHFISIFLLCLLSLIVQLYYCVNAIFMYQAPSINLFAGLPPLPEGMTYWVIPFIILFLTEALILGFLGVSCPKRLTPEIILAFFLSFMGMVLFPSVNTFLSILIGMLLWRFGAPIVHRFLPWLGKTRRFNFIGKNLAFANRDIIVGVILLLILLPGFIVTAVRGSIGFYPVELPLIGQIGDWSFIALILLSMTRVNEFRNTLPVIIIMLIICVLFFVFRETGTPATLLVMLLALLVMRAAAAGLALPSGLVAVSLAALFGICTLGGYLVKQNGEAVFTAKFADRVEQWESGYTQTDYDKPLQVQRLRVFSAAGGSSGLGLYNGHYRYSMGKFQDLEEDLMSRSDFITGVIFEELGLPVGFVIVIMLLLTAYGCYFHGIRAEKFHLAVVCFLAAGFIALRTFIQLASSTGAVINLFGGLKLGVPIVGLPMPFLSRGGAAMVVLYTCLLLVEVVKLDTV
jgi:cell division protein FtsW (lipid II flippase)